MLQFHVYKFTEITDRMVLLLLVIFGSVSREMNGCSIDVCLTWRVKSNLLDLICRVNTLTFSVEFLDNLEVERGFCSQPFPHSECFARFNDTLIKQDTRTNITMLSISGNIDSHVNGEWECRHGTKRDSAVVNVTVLKDEDSYERKWSKKEIQCWQRYLSWTFLGFIVSIIIYLIVLILLHFKRRSMIDKIYRYIQGKVKLFTMSKCNNTDGSGDCNPTDKCYQRFRSAIVIAGILFLAIPIGKGINDQLICTDEEAHLVIGVILAVSFLFFYITGYKADVDENESDNTDDDTNSACAKKSTNEEETDKDNTADDTNSACAEKSTNEEETDKADDRKGEKESLV